MLSIISNFREIKRTGSKLFLLFHKYDPRVTLSYRQRNFFSTNHSPVYRVSFEHKVDPSFIGPTCTYFSPFETTTTKGIKDDRVGLTLAPNLFLFIFLGSVTPWSWFRVRRVPSKRVAPGPCTIVTRTNLGIELQSRKKGVPLASRVYTDPPR